MVYNINMFNNKGAALLDSIMAIAIFVVLFVGFFILIQLGIQTITERKARNGALALASSRIEYIRALDYSNIGLEGGDPIGVLVSPIYSTINTVQYTITTNISWQDDPADGLSGAGDANPNDYKEVVVSVSWPEHTGEVSSVKLSTIISNFIAE